MHQQRNQSAEIILLTIRFIRLLGTLAIPILVCAASGTIIKIAFFN
jgi:hypothetical protein